MRNCWKNTTTVPFRKWRVYIYLHHGDDEGRSGGIVGSDEGLTRARINIKVEHGMAFSKERKNMLYGIF